jgi:hypothetical protein
MVVKETGVSLYGLTYPEHARDHFNEMIKHNCNAVLLAIMEFDLEFWYPNIIQIVKEAKNLGMKVYLDLWGIGKFFGGEQTSVFLQNNVKNRQVGALSGEPYVAACFNTPAFRKYFYTWVEKLAEDTEADGFFWDEPHYASGPPDWTCRCEVCQKLFKDEYGYEMPKVINEDVKRFREDKALEVLVEASRVAKNINPKLKIISCILPTLDVSHGYGDWEKVAKVKEFDVFSTSIMGYGLPLSAYETVAEKTVYFAKKYGKESQRWVMSYYSSPENLDFIRELVHLYAKKGVDSIFSWTYRAGKGTVLSAPEPDKVWDILGKAFGEVLNKQL